MTNAKIEIKARNVDGLFGFPQHMYIVYTNEAGVEMVLSAFPESNTVKGFLFDDIDVTYKNYNERSSDDFPKEGSLPHPSKILFQGTDAEVLAKINLALAERDSINSQGYDYNLPIYETILPNSSWSELNKQNSNTVAMYLAASMGLQSGVIDFVDTNQLNVPGYFATLSHSPFEKNMTSLWQAALETNQDIDNTITVLSQFINQIINIFKPDTSNNITFVQENSIFFTDLLETAIGNGFEIKYGTESDDILITSGGRSLVIVRIGNGGANEDEGILRGGDGKDHLVGDDQMLIVGDLLDILNTQNNKELIAFVSL